MILIEGWFLLFYFLISKNSLMKSKFIADDNWIKTKVIRGHPGSWADFKLFYKFKYLNFDFCSEIFLFPSMNPCTHTHSQFLNLKNIKNLIIPFFLAAFCTTVFTTIILGMISRDLFFFSCFFDKKICDVQLVLVAL